MLLYLPCGGIDESDSAFCVIFARTTESFMPVIVPPESIRNVRNTFTPCERAVYIIFVSTVP